MMERGNMRIATKIFERAASFPFMNMDWEDLTDSCYCESIRKGCTEDLKEFTFRFDDNSEIVITINVKD